MEINTEKVKQGDILSLFPNLGMEIIHHGCRCGIIGVTPYELNVIILEVPKGSMYQVNNKIWIDSFLIEQK